MTSATLALALVLTMTTSSAARADSLPDESEVKVLCDEACASALESKDFVTTKSGLRYKDIKEGDGVEPPVGFQVVVDYVAMDEKGRVFDNSLAKGKPNDIRVVDCVTSGDFDSCNVIPGLDEGLLTMKSGGVRRLYIPGELAFPKGLASAPGRPKVAPFAPVIFDVNLLYIPGFD
jgi:peptidylprolyl isomerase